MPEKVEAKRIAEILNKETAGYYIYNINITDGTKYSDHGFPGQKDIIFPLRIMEVVSYGKKVIFKLKTFEGKKSWLFSFLSLHGHWLLKEGNHTKIRLDIGKGIRVESSNDEDTYYYIFPVGELYYNDLIYGTLEYFSSIEQLELALKSVGPDLLLDDVTFDEFSNVVRRPRLKDMQIGRFLLEQKYFSGIGNYLRAEILYQAQINPFRKLSTLTDGDIGAVFVAVMDILHRCDKAGGVSIFSYVDPYGQPGKFKCLVYSEDVDPFGNKVKCEPLPKGRNIHWVPAVQI